MKSNGLRLALGWVFLMLLTAGGTFYAADALDQHGALDKLALHDKFGYAKATIASVPTQGTGATSSSAPAASGTPPASNNSQIAQYNGSTQQPQQIQPAQQTLPPASQLFPQASQQQQPQQGQQTLPNASQLFPQASQQQQPQVAPPQQAPNQQQPVPQNNPPPQISQQQLYQQQRQQQLYQQQQAQNNRPQQPVRTMSPALRDRLTDVVSRAEATFAQWRPIKRSLQSMGQPLRPEISAALGSLQRFTQQAQSLARSGDAAGAEHAMDMAEKQMQILKEARE